MAIRAARIHSGCADLTGRSHSEADQHHDARLHDGPSALADLRSSRTAQAKEGRQLSWVRICAAPPSALRGYILLSRDPRCADPLHPLRRAAARHAGGEDEGESLYATMPRAPRRSAAGRSTKTSSRAPLRPLLGVGYAHTQLDASSGSDTTRHELVVAPAAEVLVSLGLIDISAELRYNFASTDSLVVGLGAGISF